MTSCPDLLALNDEDLLQYIVGEESLSGEQQRHLEQCPICQQHLASYQDVHNLLLPQYRVECPDPMQLSLYCGDMLSHKEASAIRTHLAGCRLCANEEAMIRHELARFVHYSDPKPFSLWRFLEKSRHITAHLVVQPQPQRGGPRWPHRYQSPAINLVLDLTSTDDHQLKLLGTLQPDDEQNTSTYNGTVVDLYRLNDEHSSVELMPSGKPAGPPFSSSTVNSRGHFFFAPLPAGYYALILHLPETELVVEQVHIEQESS